jgi:hypothetical protein
VKEDRMAELAPLNEAEVRQFVGDWYRALDVHVPPEEAFAMTAPEGLMFKIPEGVFNGREGFSEIYHNWTHTFFDEVHTVKEVQFSPNGQQADLKVVVNWQGRVWNAPAAKSEKLNFDAYQTWVVERSTETNKPVIKSYIVDELKPMPGAPNLT